MHYKNDKKEFGLKTVEYIFTVGVVAIMVLVMTGHSPAAVTKFASVLLHAITK